MRRSCILCLTYAGCDTVEAPCCLISWSIAWTFFPDTSALGCSLGAWKGQLGALRRVCFGELGFVEQLDALDDDKKLL